MYNLLYLKITGNNYLSIVILSLNNLTQDLFLRNFEQQ